MTEHSAENDAPFDAPTTKRLRNAIAEELANSTTLSPEQALQAAWDVLIVVQNVLRPIPPGDAASRSSPSSALPQ